MGINDINRRTNIETMQQYTKWSKKRYFSFNFAITSVNIQYTDFNHFSRSYCYTV